MRFSAKFRDLHVSAFSIRPLMRIPKSVSLVLALMNGDLGTADGRSDLVRLALRSAGSFDLDCQVGRALHSAASYVFRTNGVVFPLAKYR
jgi:hypothetical protein